MSARPNEVSVSVPRIERLCRKAKSYLGQEEIRNIKRAYEFSAKAHIGQFRKSGEPYIQHPLAVAHILIVDMHRRITYIVIIVTGSSHD